MKAVAAALLLIMASASPLAAQVDFPGKSGAPSLSYRPPALQYQPPRLEYRAPTIRQPIIPSDCAKTAAGKTGKPRRCVSDAPKDPAG